MHEIISNINWLAVFLGAILAFLLGWLWYSPKMFGAKWAEGVGVSLADSDDLPKKAMIIQAIATFFLSWMVGVLFAHTSTFGPLILMVLTIILLMIAGGYYVKKTDDAVMIEGGFVVAMVAIMSVCQWLF